MLLLSKTSKAQTQLISVVLITGVLLVIVGSTFMWGVPLIEKGQTFSDTEQAEGIMLLLKDKIDDVVETGEQKVVSLELNGDLELTDDNSLRYSIVTRGLSVASTVWVPLAGGASGVRDILIAVDADGGSARMNLNDDVVCLINSSCTPSVKIKLSQCTGAGASIEGDYTPDQKFVLDDDEYLVHHIDCSGSVDGQALIIGPEVEVAGISGIDESGVIIAKSDILGDKYKTTYRLLYRELDDISSPNNDGYRVKLISEGNNMLLAGSHKITIRRDDVSNVVGRSKHGGDLIETKVYITMS